eukprot:169995_1
MNPFLDEENEVSIPLVSRNYSNYNSQTSTFMENKQNNNNNDDDDYGTFNARLQQTHSEPIDHKVKFQNIHKPKHQVLSKQSKIIRTDKVTGNRYRQLSAIPNGSGNIHTSLDYEKEVYPAMNMYQLQPRNESLANLFLNVDNTSQMTHTSLTMQSHSRFSKKDVSDEALHGYEWLGKSSAFGSHLRKAAANASHNQGIALLLLALMVTVVAFIISQMTSFCWGVINYVYTNNMYNKILIFLGCLVLKCGFVFAAIFFTITTPQTAGSGIPELKAILSGIWIRRYLSIRGFFIKSLALVCALGSGLPIGIEGPVIHISAIIGRQLTKISMFQHIDRKMLLSAACACGIAVIFGAPIGGVLFSIEVTHHYYKIDSYWSAFLCATFAALFTIIVQAIAPTTLQLLHTSFEGVPYKTYEFVIFILLGCISGFLGASYVQLHKYFTLCRPKIARYHNGFWNNSYVLAGIVTSTYVLCAFILGEFAFQPSRMAISDLFNAKSLQDCDNPKSGCNFTDWGQGLGVYANLACFSILNYLFSIWFLVLDWPCGCFASVFAIGAASGRLLGEVLNSTIMNWSGTSLLAATYAVVGAASLVGGVTRTFSVAVIVIEMTYSVELSVPVLLGVILSWTIASWLSDSLYDSILNLRGIPLLPITPKHPINYSVRPIRPFIAADLMVDIRKYGYLNDKSSFKEVALMLQHSNEIFFPVLSTNTRTLLGEVSRQILEEELKSFGYGKHTEARRKLVISATKRLQALSMYSMHETTTTNTNDIIITTDSEPSQSDDETLLSIDINDHFASVNTVNDSITDLDLQSTMDCDKKDDKAHKKPTQSIKKRKKKHYKQNKNNKNNIKRIWDEKGYLKQRKERTEWIYFHEAKWIQHMNISPVTVIPTMPISQIYVLFHVLHPDKIYVAKRNELVGVVDEHILLERERLERKGGMHRNKSVNNNRNDNETNGPNNAQNNDGYNGIDHN